MKDQTSMKKLSSIVSRAGISPLLESILCFLGMIVIFLAIFLMLIGFGIAE